MKRAGSRLRLNKVQIGAIVILLVFSAYWLVWSRGFAMASATGPEGRRFVMRKVPYDTNPLWMILDDGGNYHYRAEVWQGPIEILRGFTISGDSNGADAAAVKIRGGECEFYLDGEKVWVTGTGK